MRCSRIPISGSSRFSDRQVVHGYWREFSEIAIAHLLAVASPGPDFAIVLKQSLVHGRRTALWTSLGIGSAILVHIGYSLLGLGLLLRSSPLWFDVVKYIGAAYIAWLGIQGLRARPRAQAVAAESSTMAAAPPFARHAFFTGFFTNALNPKATLFFISLYVLIVSPQTPRIVQAGYGLWMSLTTMAWFSLVSLMFTRASLRARFLRHGHWIDRVLGVVFLAFAAGLALAKLK